MAKVPLLPLFQDLRGVIAPYGVQTAVNLHIETRNHYLEAHLFNYDRLVVTFEDARLPKDRPDRYRQGWGVAPFLKRGVSVLAVKPKQRNWFSQLDLPEAFRDLQPFFQRFGEITTYGMSMGGFAALTFADVLGAKRVVTMAPQSTYRMVDGKREHRFPPIFDWSHAGPWGDAVTGCKTPQDVWIFYDRMERTDKWHAGRFQGDNIRRVSLPYFAHGVPRMLQNVGALSKVVDLVVTGKIDLDELYRLARRRREFAQYLTFLRMKARQHPGFEPVLRRILGEEDLDWDQSAREALGKNDEFLSQTE